METADPRSERWALLRDVLVFQLKLALDAARDLLLSPVSLAALALGLVAGGDHPRRYFANLLALGRRSEHWIDLFGSESERAGPGATGDDGERLDAYVARLEALLVAQSERGGVTAATRRQVDRLLDAVQDRGRPGRRRGSAPEPRDP